MSKTTSHLRASSRASGKSLAPGTTRRRRQYNASPGSSRGLKWTLVMALFVAVAAGLIVAYRSFGPEKASSSPEMLANQAPDFGLQTADGRTVSLADYRGKKNVLLFFSEGYGCDPCWQQTAALQKDQQILADMNVEAFGVMVDPPALIKKEMPRWGLTTLPILVDQSTSVSKSYGALGGMHANKPDHKFVLINTEGDIVWAVDYPSMRVDSEEVINRVRELVQ